MTILKILLFVYMAVMIVFSFTTPPPMSGSGIDDVAYITVSVFNGGPSIMPVDGSKDLNGNGILDITDLVAFKFSTGPSWAPASRIFYYHVPFAFVSFIAFAHAMVQSILYLKRKDPIADSKAAMAAGLGLMFCFAATVSGSIFAKVAWSTYWNWDPRQTSILILLVIYGAYFALRQSIAQPERRASFSAVYSILAFVTVPFFGFIVPRVYQSLHPEDTLVAKGQLNIGGYVAFIFLSSLFCFLCTYFWLHSIGNRIQKLEQKQLEDSYDFERA